MVLGLICFLALNPISGQIATSKHDFSGQGWSGGEICIACHTPHSAETSVPDAPLWNHEVTTTTFTLYTSPTLNWAPEQPRGPTKLCLSCHDGTVAIDSFGGNVGSTLISGPANLGTDLSNDHPVSVEWRHQTDLPVCGQCHSMHGPLYPEDLPFFDGYLECSTCHDVHSGTGFPSLLRMDLQGSYLCLYCHNK